MAKESRKPIYVQEPLKECKRLKNDCVNYVAGYCVALTDTRFKDECAFYKSIEQNYKECMENVKRLRR